MPCSPSLLCKRHTNLLCPFSRQRQHIIPVNHNLKFNRHRLTVYRNYFVFLYILVLWLYMLCSCSFGGLLRHISNNTLIKKEVSRICLLLLIVSAHFIPMYTQGRNQEGGGDCPPIVQETIFSKC